MSVPYLRSRDHPRNMSDPNFDPGIERLEVNSIIQYFLRLTELYKRVYPLSSANLITSQYQIQPV